MNKIKKGFNYFCDDLNEDLKVFIICVVGSTLMFGCLFLFLWSAVEFGAQQDDSMEVRLDKL